MKGYDSKLAKKLEKLRVLTKKLYNELPEEHKLLRFALNVVLSIKECIYSIAVFPPDTYNVVLSKLSAYLFKSNSNNTKRTILIDNRDDMIHYDKEKGYLFDRGDLARDKFAISLYALWQDAIEGNYLQAIPDNLQPLAEEIEGILQEWSIWADKFTHYDLEDTMKIFEKSEQHLETVWNIRFKTEINRVNGKNTQREERKKLYMKFQNMRPGFKNDQATYVAMAEEELASVIKEFEGRKNSLSYPDGVKFDSKIRNEIRQRAKAIKLAVYRERMDQKDDSKLI